MKDLINVVHKIIEYNTVIEYEKKPIMESIPLLLKNTINVLCDKNINNIPIETKSILIDNFKTNFEKYIKEIIYENIKD
jgi:hypothetical protein